MQVIRDTLNEIRDGLLISEHQIARKLRERMQV